MTSREREREAVVTVGNRSSFLHTMTDGGGRFRVIPEPSRFVARARLCLALARDELGRVIARTVPEV